VQLKNPPVGGESYFQFAVAAAQRIAKRALFVDGFFRSVRSVYALNE
jgi:hypothetical protein